MKIPTASGIYHIEQNEQMVEIFVYRASYAGGSETTVTTCASDTLTIRQGDTGYVACADNGGTVLRGKTRAETVNLAIAYLTN